MQEFDSSIPTQNPSSCWRTRSQSTPFAIASLNRSETEVIRIGVASLFGLSIGQSLRCPIHWFKATHFRLFFWTATEEDFERLDLRRFFVSVPRRNTSVITSKTFSSRFSLSGI